MIGDHDPCPTGDEGSPDDHCWYCSGEKCATHHFKRCDCDMAQRHPEARS